jgi:hypothetical protein
MVYSTTADNHYQAIGSAPSFRFADTITSPTYTGIIGLATATNNFIIGAAAGDMVLSNNTTSSIGNFLFGTGATERMRINASTGNISINSTNNTYKFDVTGTGRFSGQLRLESTITNGTYTYTLPSATGTIALTSDIPSGAITGSGTTNYLPKFTGTSTIGNSAISDDGTTVTLVSRALSGTSATFSGQLVLNAANNQVRSGNELRFYRTDNGIYTQLYDGGAANGFVIDNRNGDGFNFQSAGTSQMRISSSGNLGLGVTPSAWSSIFRVNQIGNNGGFLASRTDGINQIQLGVNGYFNGSNWIYSTNESATKYYQAGGSHIWETAPSGTAGNAISFTQAMTLNASGNLSIGNTNDTYKLDVTGTGRFSAAVQINSNTTGLILNRNAVTNYNGIGYWTAGVGQWFVGMRENLSSNNYIIYNEALGTDVLTLSVSTGAALFSSRLRVNGATDDADIAMQVKAPSGTGKYIMFGRDASDIAKFTLSAEGAATFSGKVGVGGASATYTLTAYNSTNGTTAAFGGTARGLRIDNDGTFSSGRTTIFGVDSSFYGSYQPLAINGSFLYFGVAGNDNMVINASGNVGIGTTSPSSKLDILGANEVMNIAGTNAISAYTGYYYNTSTLVGYIGNGSSILSGAASSDFIFRSQSDLVYATGGNNERMRITSGGNVGIGTTSPNGNAATTNLLHINGSTSNAEIHLTNSSTGSTATDGLTLLQYGTQSVLFNLENDAMLFGTNNTERMRITSGGNVGINTSSPSYTLDVNGTARFGSAIVASLGTGLVYSSGGTLTSTNPSDQRLKNTIKSLSYGLNEVLQLNPKTFYYNDDVNKDRLKYGFIAQEVKGIMPELARKLNAETDYLGLETEGIYVTLVNAIKELKAELDILKNK